MDKQKLLDRLISFGLDEIEAEVYLYLLENGPRTPLQLFRETGLNRSKIYRYVDRLKARGLVEDSNASWGIKLRATSPQNLNLFLGQEQAALEAKKKELPELISDLGSLPTFNEREFEVKHFHGVEGLKQMMWNQLSAKKEILYFGYETRNEAVGKSFAELVREEQVERRLKVYEVENATDQGVYSYTKVRDWEKFYDSRHIPPAILTIRHNLVIFNNTVSVMNWSEGNQVGIEIVNTAFAAMMTQMFWKFWEIAGNLPKPDRKDRKKTK